MKRFDLEKMPRAVQEFVRGLLEDPDVVEFEAKGQVLLRILPAPQLATEQRRALLEEGRALVDRARARNENVPARTTEREVRQALRVVHRRQRGSPRSWIPR